MLAATWALSENEPDSDERITMSAPKNHHHGKTPTAIRGSAIAAVGSGVMAGGFLLSLTWPVIGIGAGILLLALAVDGSPRVLGCGQ